MKYIEKDRKNYPKYAQGRAERSNALIDTVKAFLVGGSICTLGQLFFEIYTHFKIDADLSRTLASISIVLITALLTGFGIFDSIARHAGAGTLVPISGFANSVVAPAIDNKAEGWILGVGTKIFIIAGPVIVYGTLASVICGVIYWAVRII